MSYFDPDLLPQEPDGGAGWERVFRNVGIAFIIAGLLALARARGHSDDNALRAPG